MESPAQMQSQKLERNGKTHWFFPDITINDITRGFLVDESHLLLPYITNRWNDYVKTAGGGGGEQCFSAHLYFVIESQQLHNAIFENYQAIPTTELIVVGITIPSYSKVVKKRRVSAL